MTLSPENQTEWVARKQDLYRALQWFVDASGINGFPELDYNAVDVIAQETLDQVYDDQTEVPR